MSPAQAQIELITVARKIERLGSRIGQHGEAAMVEREDLADRLRRLAYVIGEGFA